MIRGKKLGKFEEKTYIYHFDCLSMDTSREIWLEMKFGDKVYVSVSDWMNLVVFVWQILSTTNLTIQIVKLNCPIIKYLKVKLI